jgi:predicted nucleotidyltransferase
MIPAVAENASRLTALCEEFGVERLEVFGSAAVDNQFDPERQFNPERSDLDFIVEFQPGQDLGPWLRHYFAFRSALADLFGRSVDLVMASAIKNPYFLREANRTRRLVYGR